MAIGLRPRVWENAVTSDQLCGVLLRYAGASPRQLFLNIVADFRAVASTVSQEQLRRGLAATLYAAPADVITELFRHSDVNQRVAVLRILFSYLDRKCLDFLADAGVLGFPPSSLTIAPEVASRLSPKAIASLAAHAADQDSAVIDDIAAFYARSPGVIGYLPARALTHIMLDLANRTLQTPSKRV